MKILFLDHHGVMRITPHPHPGNLIDFDRECINILNSILELDDTIEIVVSSDWKYWVSLEEMQEFYKIQGIRKAPIDYTPKTDNYDYSNYAYERANEIKKWLENNTVSVWIAVDDIDMRQYLDNFVWINKPDEGLKGDNIKESILNILSK